MLKQKRFNYKVSNLEIEELDMNDLDFLVTRSFKFNEYYSRLTKKGMPFYGPLYDSSGLLLELMDLVDEQA